MRIIYEDNHLIAVNKEQGQLVQGDRTGDISLDTMLKGYLKKKYNKPGDVFLGVVHRLDRPVSGVVVFARTSKALTRMNELFREKQVQKVYWCITGELPKPENSTLHHYLKKNEKQNKSYAYSSQVKGSKEASLTYRLLSRSDRYFLLHVDLHTGRHHQIRCQLAASGLPVKGDLKYGYSRSNPDGSISLHARRLSFVHPVKKEILELSAKPPDDPLWRALTASVEPESGKN
ncbi:MAG: RluA family pseudouridine synthase [Bacteroidales bacterium]|nr:RluA family pseudouridine synthase [Bacteroidales bacterium]